MKKKSICILFACLMSLISAECMGQKLYNDTINAEKQIQDAIFKAEKEGKYVFCMVGGNWCKWCLMFDEFYRNTKEVKEILDQNFVLVHINFSKENRNESALKLLGKPQRFGFPVFVILNDRGERIHTQNSAYLEQGQGYDTKKVVEFLSQWSKKTVEN